MLILHFQAVGAASHGLEDDIQDLERTSSQALNELGRALDLCDTSHLSSTHFKLRSDLQKLALVRDQAKRCLLDGLLQWERAATAAEAEQKALQQAALAAVHAGKASEIPQLYQKIQKAGEVAKMRSALSKTVMTELTEQWNLQQSELHHEVRVGHANHGQSMDTATEGNLPDLDRLLESFRRSAKCAADIVQELDSIGEQITNALQALKAAAVSGSAAIDQIHELDLRIKEKVLFICFIVSFFHKRTGLWL